MKPLQKKQFIALSRGPGVGLTTTEASEIFYKLDVNKSGSINYAQIHALTHNIERTAKSNDVCFAFLIHFMFFLFTFHLFAKGKSR